MKERDSSKKVGVIFRLEPNLLASLKTEAKRKGASVSELVRSCIEDSLLPIQDSEIASLPARVIRVSVGQLEEYIQKLGKDLQEIFCTLPDSNVIDLNKPLWRNLIEQGTRIRFVLPQNLLTQVGPDLRRLYEFSLPEMGSVKVGVVDEGAIDEMYVGVKSSNNHHHSFIKIRHDNENNSLVMLYVVSESGDSVNLSNTAEEAWEQAKKTTWLTA